MIDRFLIAEDLELKSHVLNSPYAIYRLRRLLFALSTCRGIRRCAECSVCAKAPANGCRERVASLPSPLKFASRSSSRDCVSPRRRSPCYILLGLCTLADPRRYGQAQLALFLPPPPSHPLSLFLAILNTFLHCLPVDCPSSTLMMTSAFWMSHYA